MNITVSGRAVCLDWLCQRLQAKGHTLTHTPPPSHGSLSFIGLSTPDSALNINKYDHADHAHIACHYTLSEQHYIELVGAWNPIGIEHGFILFIGSTKPRHLINQTTQLLLNDLAPQKDAWLYCGPLGSAAFTAHIFTLLGQLGPSMAPANWNAIKTTDWRFFVLYQQALNQHIRSLSKRYLSTCPPTTQAPTPCYQASTLAPQQQHHYAFNLAEQLSAIPDW